MEQKEMTEEPENNMEPSTAAEFFLKPMKALERCADLECGKSFGIAAEGYSLLLLRDIAADSYSVGKKAFVVIDHGSNGYEVQRLPDGCNVKLFYKHLQSSVETEKGKPIEVDSATSEIKKKCTEYMEFGIEHAHKYDGTITKEMKSSTIVSYAYIQRRISAMAVIRKNGASAITLAIAELVELKDLTEVSAQVASDRFGKKAKLYQINF